MTDSAAVQVRDLRMSYGATQVLCGVDFEVRYGEVFCLLGPNGAGKTTTLEILEGFRRPTAGTVRVLGLDPTTQAAGLRGRAGVVLQECGFSPAPRGRPRSGLPRRAHHRFRPGGPQAMLGGDREPQAAGQDDPAHHPL